MVKICIKGSCVSVPQWLEYKSFAKADPHTSIFSSVRMCTQAKRHGIWEKLEFRQKKTPPARRRGERGIDCHSGLKTDRKSASSTESRTSLNICSMSLSLSCKSPKVSLMTSILKVTRMRRYCSSASFSVMSLRLS
jgi:hypothetical protein